MYKNFSLEDLTTIQNNFFWHLHKILDKERCQTLKEYCKILFTDGNEIMYFYRGNPIFSCRQTKKNYIFTDEEDSIQVPIDKEDLPKLHGLYKRFYMQGWHKKSTQKSIEEILMEAYKEKQFATVGSKPYLVYDIETDADVFDVKQQKFLLAYAAIVDSDGSITYKYIDQDWLQDFVNFMLEFDGHIIWYNNIYFDNPVVIHNIKGTQEQIDILNQKSIDLFVFLNYLTGKKLWLNKVAGSLIGVEKTLSSWLEWSELWKKYETTWQKRYLEKFKEYCKNDVKMTVLLLYFLLYYKKIFFDNKELSFDIQEFLQHAKHSDTEEETTFSNNAMF